MIDLHAHILPQLDDGAASEKEAREMAAIAAQCGITCLVATPHFIEGSFEPSPGAILEKVQRLNAFAREQGLNITILPGMEVALNPRIPQWLEGKRLLTLGGTSRCLLLEMPVMEIPPYTDALLFQLQIKGIIPVLAHPERCRPLSENPAWLLEAVKRGARVQITGDSLAGRFGKTVQRVASFLAEAGAVHALGSDAHSSRDRRPDLRRAARVLEEMLGKQRAATILRAEALFDGTFAPLASFASLPSGPLSPPAEGGSPSEAGAAAAGRTAGSQNPEAAGAASKKTSNLWRRLLNSFSRQE